MTGDALARQEQGDRGSAAQHHHLNDCHSRRGAGAFNTGAMLCKSSQISPEPPKLLRIQPASEDQFPTLTTLGARYSKPIDKKSTSLRNTYHVFGL